MMIRNVIGLDVMVRDMVRRGLSSRYPVTPHYVTLYHVTLHQIFQVAPIASIAARAASSSNSQVPPETPMPPTHSPR